MRESESERAGAYLELKVPKATDFRTVRCQASVFTPSMQFRSAKVLAHLLSEFASSFDGETISLPIPEGVPREMPQLIVKEMPQVILKSADGRLHLQAGPARLDVIQEEDSIPREHENEFFRWATQLILSYLHKNQAKAGRVACVLHKVARDTSPAVTLSRHFCQERWFEKPLNRPGDFQLHAQKRFRLDELFEVNSWVRCKAATVSKGGQPEPPGYDHIVVEQDFNSPAELMETREMSDGEISRFFEFAPQEMRVVLEYYFPESAQ